MDIVDMAYYEGILWQVDLVFIKHSIVEANPKLKPFEHDNFSFEKSKWFLLFNYFFYELFVVRRDL